MEEAELHAKSKSKSEECDNSSPTDNFSEQDNYLEFDIDPLFIVNELKLDFDDVLPLNSFVNARETQVSSSYLYDDFSPMGDDQMPLSMMY